jgi:hypothetical protein
MLGLIGGGHRLGNGELMLQDGLEAGWEGNHSPLLPLA